MIKVFRQVALGEKANTAGGKMLSCTVRSLYLLITFLCFLDAVNADVLYASARGDVHFQDNPLIVDSQFDTSSVTATPVGATSIYRTAVLSHHSGIESTVFFHFLGTTLYEDVDSPTVLDGASTSTLTYHILPSIVKFKIERESVVTPLDRTISFLQLLI